MVDRDSQKIRSFMREISPIANLLSALAVLAVGVIVIAALYLARELLVPLALAMLLSFTLVPLVSLLRRWHLGRLTSVFVAVLAAFLVISVIGSLIGTQIARLAENLPQYQSNISEKIQSLRGSATGAGIVGRASGVLKNLREEVTNPAAPSEPAKAPNGTGVTPQASQTQQPIPVEIHQPDPTALELIQALISPLIQPLATTGIVFVFVVFFLVQREDLRDRFIRLAGSRDLPKTTRGLDDAAQRVSRYLISQTAINTCFGVFIGIGLMIIGIPNPVLWGILAMLLRFVPYIGPVIAALFPAILALAIDPGWSMLAWTLLLFGVVEPITGQVVEPLVYGHSTGLSAVAIVVAAAFWTWLWGPVGLLLSTPLTLCLVVLGRHVDRLEFLDIILGDQPVATPEENFYQRMLADDAAEAAQQAERFLKEKSLSTYYDEVAIRGLALAQLDVNRGLLDHERRLQVKDAVLEVIDNLSDYAKQKATGGEAETAGDPEELNDGSPPRLRQSVACIAGRGSLDEAAAAMLGQLLEQRGFDAPVVPSDAVSAAHILRLDLQNVGVVCLSYLEPGGLTNARYLARRLRRKLPNVLVLVGFWTITEENARARDALADTGADRLFFSLSEAVEEIAMTMDERANNQSHAQDHSRVLPVLEQNSD